MESRVDLSERVTYGCYSKHKYYPTAYNLSPYAGQDEERTYCDEHAHFGKDDFKRIQALLVRGVMLGLWSDQANGDTPNLLWTIDESGWIFELRITNSGQAQYHGYPVLPGYAFARDVLVRSREAFIGLTQNTFAPPELYGILDFYQTTAIRIVGAINSCFI
jgi:hypothetical protein